MHRRTIRAERCTGQNRTQREIEAKRRFAALHENTRSCSLGSGYSAAAHKTIQTEGNCLYRKIGLSGGGFQKFEKETRYGTGLDLRKDQ